MKTLLRSFRTRAPFTDAAALILRLSLGGMMALHGFGKVAVVGLDVVGEDMVAHGFPYWGAHASTVVELVAGLLLIVGWHTRLAAVALLPICAGILAYHFPMGWVFHNPGGGWEYPQLILEVTVAVLLLGGGRYSLDGRAGARTATSVQTRAGR